MGRPPPERRTLWLRLGLSGTALALIALLIAGLAGLITVSIAVSPDQLDSGQVALTDACPRRTAGLYCPSCGLTRSFTAMSRGHLGRAWRYNRSGPLLYTLTWLGLIGLAWSWAWVLRNEFLVVFGALRRIEA